MKTKRIAPRMTERGFEIGPEGTSFGRTVTLVNPSEQSWRKQRYVLWFGTAPRYLMVWANGLEDALENCASWVDDHAPGIFCDDAVAEAYHDAIAEGLDEDDARERAEMDTTSLDGCHYLNSDEWGIALSNPTRAQLDEFLYPSGLLWKERECCKSFYQPRCFPVSREAQRAEMWGNHAHQE